MIIKLILIAIIYLIPTLTFSQDDDAINIIARCNPIYKDGCLDTINKASKAIEEYSQKMKEIENSKSKIFERDYIYELTMAYGDRSHAKNITGDYKGAIEDKTKQIYYWELWENSRTEIKEIPTLHDASSKLLFSSYYFERGDLYLETGNYKAAIKDFNKAIQLYPDNTNAIAYRGYAKYQLGDYRGAIKDYDKAIEQSPSFAFYYFSRGLAKINLDQKDSGCLDLSKAGELGYMETYDAIKEYCQ